MSHSNSKYIEAFIQLAKNRSPAQAPAPVAVGGTGYLDERFVPAESVSWGLDRFGRRSVTLCLRPVDVGLGRDDRHAVCTFFQRYKSDEDIWVMAVNAGRRVRFSDGVVSESAFIKLVELLNTGTCTIDDLDDFDNGPHTWALATPEEVRMNLKWVDRPRAADNKPGVAVHTDAPKIIVYDEKAPFGRHEEKE